MPLAASAVSAVVLACFFLPAGCGFHGTSHAPTFSPGNAPLVRVRLMQGLDALTLTAANPPGYSTTSDPTPRALDLPANQPVRVALQGGAWKVGNASLGGGTLTLTPAGDGSLSVANASSAPNANHANDGAYRGQYRLVPAAGGKFDLVNEVDLESYLAGVLPKELPRGWHEEVYKAQAIVARTYALYEKAQAPSWRAWDVYPDTRSQMYGGITAETDKSRRAVNDTSGIVVVAGPPGQEHIFEAYFSSCCGGVTQSSVDAFGESYQEALSDQSNGSACNASPAFNWGPVVVKKEELTRRVRLWGARRGRPEKSMALIKSVSIQASNPWGRPTRFLVEDAAGNRYSLNGEELRWSVNFDADGDPSHPSGLSTLKSSFVKVICDSDSIRFVEGHGWGHGVGFCQWCGQRRAEDGMHCDEIVLAAYPRTKLARAY